MLDVIPTLVTSLEVKLPSKSTDLLCWDCGFTDWRSEREYPPKLIPHFLGRCVNLKSFTLRIYRRSLVKYSPHNATAQLELTTIWIEKVCKVLESFDSNLRHFILCHEQDTTNSSSSSDDDGIDADEPQGVHPVYITYVTRMVMTLTTLLIIIQTIQTSAWFQKFKKS